MEDENGWEGNMKTESEEKEGCGQVPWCGLSLSLWSVICRPALAGLGCIQFNFIFHYLGIYRHINTRLFRDKMTHLSLLSSPHQGGAQLPCLSGNIFMGCTLHSIDRLSTGSGSLLTAQQTLISIFLTPMSSLIIIHWLARLQFFRTVLCSYFVLLLMHRSGLNSFQVHELCSI